MARASRKATATERQIKLALYVQAHGPVSRAQIQRHLPEYAASEARDAASRKKQEATVRRRFERDKAALAKAGIELAASENGLYRILPAENGVFSELEEGSVQSALLRVSSAALLQDPVYEHAGNLRMALSKLSGPLEIPDALPWAEQEALEGLRPAEESCDGTRRKAKAALDASKLLRFEYTDAAGRMTKREVEPIGLFASNGHEYLAAWDNTRQGERCFRLDRMGRANVNESGRGSADFEPRRFEASRWQLLPFQMGDATGCEATVRISPSALWQARNLCSSHGRIVEDAIGSCFWQVSFADARGLAAWCIANGPGLVPLQPEEVARAYWELVDEASTWEEPGSTVMQYAKREASQPHTEEARQNSTDEEFLPLEEEEGTDPYGLELAAFADRLAARYVTANSNNTSGSQTLTDDDLLFAMLALVEQAGAVSIPQSAKLLGIKEAKAYSVLETLAFCYDSAAGVRLHLGEMGCSFAALEEPVGIRMSLTEDEASALAGAAVAFTSGSIISTVAVTCGDEHSQSLEISYWKEGSPAPEPRRIDPQTMVVRDGHTYLQAWCHKAQAERLFRLDRIIAVAVANEADEQSDVIAPTSTTRRAATKAIIGLAPGVAVPMWPRVSRGRKPSTDGTTTFSVPWFGSPWLPKQLASYGRKAVRIEPRALARAVGDYARSLRE